MKTITLTITNIPNSEPGQLLDDLVEMTSHVDAPLDMEAVKRACEAWVIVSTMATGLGEMDDEGPKIEVATLIAMFAAKAAMTPVTG